MQMKTKHVITIALIASAFFIAFFTLKGGEKMVTVYVTLIIYGRRTIDTVPGLLKEAVLADLNAVGLDGYGKPVAA